MRDVCCQIEGEKSLADSGRSVESANCAGLNEPLDEIALVAGDLNLVVEHRVRDAPGFLDRVADLVFEIWRRIGGTRDWMMRRKLLTPPSAPRSQRTAFASFRSGMRAT